MKKKSKIQQRNFSLVESYREGANMLSIAWIMFIFIFCMRKTVAIIQNKDLNPKIKINQVWLYLQRQPKCIINQNYAFWLSLQVRP